jgi:uncharacterized protein (TIGR03067 family)
MRFRSFLVLVAAWFAVGVMAQDRGSDKNPILGVWRFTSSERAGKSKLSDEKVQLDIEFSAQTFRFYAPAGAKHPQSYKLDTSAKPKTIDWILGNGAKPLHGIYEIDGDTLKICWGKAGGERPKAFTSTADGEEWNWVLKRVKEK